MRAIILAAGLGRRMQPLTLDTHKTLLPIAGSTIIDRLITSLTEVGIDDVTVVTGYRATDVESHLATSFPDVRFRFVRNDRYEQTNNIYSMALAFEHEKVSDDVLLIESDLICDASVLRRLIAAREPNVALVDRYRPGMDGTVVSVANGVITEVIPTHLQQGDFSFADKYKTLNIYKFSGEFCRETLAPLVTYYARAIDANSFYELILGILIYMRQATIAAEIVDDLAWAEVDDPNDLRVAQFLFDAASRRSILEQTKGGYWAFDVLDFAYLRNMYFPTTAMYAEMRAVLPELIQNYGSSQVALDEKLRYVLMCQPDRAVLFSGASQAIRWIGERWANSPALLPSPTFLEWPRSLPRHTTYSDRGVVDMNEVGAAADRTEVVVFVNPNNPTGTLLDSQAIHEFAAARPDKLVIVDESFGGFGGQQSVVALLDDTPLPNLIVVASLSKSLGVPGVRLGFLYTCDDQLRRDALAWLPIWNVNSVAEHLLELMLKHRDALEQSFRRTGEDRSLLSKQLAALSVVDAVLPSAGNFLLVRLAVGQQGAEAMADALLQRDSIYVKDVSQRVADGAGWYRVAVRLPAENERLCQALDRIASDLALPIVVMAQD